VRLAIDDFGTGYSSSLSYLQRFPIDVLKIDKSFVDGVARGGSDAALARTIVALGDALALRTVAEGAPPWGRACRRASRWCPARRSTLGAAPALGRAGRAAGHLAPTTTSAARYKLDAQSRGFTASPGGRAAAGALGVPRRRAGERARRRSGELRPAPARARARVELLSGTASLLGPNSLGGAVNLVTQRGDGAPSARSSSAAARTAYSGEGPSAGLARGWSYYAGGGYDATRGWRQSRPRGSTTAS
jgi:hypothetical protein